MDTRPIGLFDSGLGGLTAVRELQTLLPHESLIYFGDTGRVPYGSRSRETIIEYAREDVAFLRTFDIKAIVVACGTVSTTALDLLKQEHSIPIWGVVQAAAEAAVYATQSNHIGLIGTQATIRSHAYEHHITRLNPKIQVFAHACPLFVPLVENGRFQCNDPVTRLVAEEYLAPFLAQKVDTLILGCTHYPLLAPIIQSILGDDVTLINVGAQCAQHVARALAQQHALAPPTQQGSSSYYVSDAVADFSTLASLFLQQDVNAGVRQVDITQYSSKHLTEISKHPTQ